MRATPPTVWEDHGRGGMALENGPHLDTPAWHTWLEDAATTSFSYPVYNPTRGYIEGFMTVRKERRARGGVYWTAYWRVGGRLRKVYLGPASAVTGPRLRAVATAWLTQAQTVAAFPRPAGAVDRDAG